MQQLYRLLQVLLLVMLAFNRGSDSSAQCGSRVMLQLLALAAKRSSLLAAMGRLALAHAAGDSAGGALSGASGTHAVPHPEQVILSAWAAVLDGLLDMGLDNRHESSPLDLAAFAPGGRMVVGWEAEAVAHPAEDVWWPVEALLSDAGLRAVFGCAAREGLSPGCVAGVACGAADHLSRVTPRPRAA